jgi:hypothetical protein
MRCQTEHAGNSVVFRKCCGTVGSLGLTHYVPGPRFLTAHRREVSCAVMLRGKGARQILLTLGKNQTPPHFYGGVGFGDRQQGGPVYGVYNSALSSSLTASLPPALTTLPLWSTVEVWPARAWLMLPVAVHVPVAGL